MPERLPAIERLGDSALLLRWHGGIDSTINAHVHRVARILNSESPPWLLDCVPAYASLALMIDLDHADTSLTDAERWLTTRLSIDHADGVDSVDTASRPCVEIPVCYDADFGLDLPTIAEATGFAIREIVERHSAPVYRVAMLGFSPGFPYLLGLDAALAMPRLGTPRVDIAAGSVAIGGAQTGIYPSSSPGGWRLVGRTPLNVFDPARTSPSLLHPGDSVRFVAINRLQFDEFTA